MEGDVAALHNEILLVLDGSLYHFPEDGPKVIRQFVIIHRCQIGLTAANEAHFQMVNGQVGILMLFQQLLGIDRLSHMTCPTDQNNQSTHPFALL